MIKEMVTTLCFDCSYSFVLNPVVHETLLKNYGYKLEFCKKFVYGIDLAIDGRNVRKIMRPGQIKHWDCLLCRFLDSFCSFLCNGKTTRVLVQAKISRSSYYCG